MALFKRTTMAITAERKIKMERLAIDASQEAGTSIAWTDIVNYLIDNYSKDAAKDIVSNIKSRIREAENHTAFYEAHEEAEKRRHDRVSRAVEENKKNALNKK
ncbi:hypothetical protein AM420_001890 [Klebsiella pneumoniae]|jgi:hypothetical protein|uniref:Uncharacterized protein n=2 Tax=Enterobacteriaceae TaxID=543 RepID=A0A9Q9MQW1_RAOOR|nr:hypothetical protein [Raoultella ornithinolytica]OKN42791.1 hypothetical protein AM420_005760 [Klebsiella pneumoniae]HBD2493425.1 hypothetical protein [Escherichia coli]EJG2384235.1 hypothetical protein [Raoultella ornithinolytica]OKN56339.1 hypothetical protein AM420_001882 [Klebsiella pneumoniae]OKN56347.1 hypothetical protein AM420_001890 [Klebsiella pneumoniae]